MADMKSFDEPMPSVGIFWYDQEAHDFFGVYKKELTPKMVEEAKANGINVINYKNPLFYEKPNFLLHDISVSTRFIDADECTVRC